MDLPQKVIFKMDKKISFLSQFFVHKLQESISVLFLFTSSALKISLLFYETIDINHKQNCKNKQIIWASIIYSEKSHPQFQDVS